MNFCALTLLLGSFSIIAHCVFPPGSCDSYVNITEPYRNIAFTSSSFSGYSHDDGGLSRQWSRFTGIGGDRIVQSRHSGPRGGFRYPICFQFNHPTEESSTASTGTAYVYAGGCDSHSIAMEVVLCPGSFYIFKPVNHPQSSSGFITCKRMEIIVVIDLVTLALFDSCITRIWFGDLCVLEGRIGRDDEMVGKPPPEDSFLEWLNRMCIIVGLFFFALCILTFLLCSWNPKINNTARLHLCLNMASSHLLLLTDMWSMSWPAPSLRGSFTS
ncbi:uncharacterized protein LOC119126225 [Syngnathus acus]|uniref:uncharacterized protein LOC119126225 n=1 Tax=Syngnathus acus TaxID=161584 RepID=UPI001885F3B7|nr:uncharacterized protein LOC119126225 [Syngnathus acus]